MHVTKRIAEKAREGQLDPENIDVGTIESLLYTHDLPPLDLVIRLLVKSACPISYYGKPLMRSYCL